MTLLGTLIKSAIEFTHSVQSLSGNAQQQQVKQLEKLLNKASATSFGKYYGFEDILRSDRIVASYQGRLPIFEYEQMHDRWWAQQQKLPDISWPGMPPWFALSSGTTGDTRKRIPVTKDMLASIRSVGMSQVASLANFDLPAELFDKEVLMLGSSASLSKRNGHLEGEISGITSGNLPGWFDGFYKPGREIAAIEDWDERVAEIVRRAPDWDIAGLAGIPSWIQIVLERIVEAHGLDYIQDIWPHLSIYASGGVAFEPYRKGFDKLMNRPMTYLDTYLASEGFFAFTARPGTMEMELALEHGIFYEFIPFDERGFDEMGNLISNPLCLTMAEVEEDQEYAMLISTPAGTWRYMIGDTIKFTDLKRREMHISGRTKYFLNVVGSQLSEEKLNTAIARISKKLSAEMKEFAVAAMPDGEGGHYHQWVIASPEALREKDLAERLDQTLKELNHNYEVARSKALKGVKVKVAHPERVYDWLEKRKKKGGQIKMPKVMKSEMMEDLITFL